MHIAAEYQHPVLRQDIMHRAPAKASMKPLLLLVLATVLAWSLPAQAAENLFKDGGFEQFLPQPDDQGNPFKVWSGWKWDGNCRRAADTEI